MKKSIIPKLSSVSNFLWNAFCISSIIGIWPRFIEPLRLKINKLNLPISDLPEALHGLKILQLSDLHLDLKAVTDNFDDYLKSHFLKRLIKTVKSLKPDVIVFTGDFLCYSKLENPGKLKDFLSNFKAPHGCYAILGNHDYEKYVSVNHEGHYDVIESSHPSLLRGFKRLLSSITLTKTITNRAKSTSLHSSLIEVLANSSFKLLNNETIPILINGSILNICGCGEYTLGRFQPVEAFSKYNVDYPGIVLVHNPDAIPYLTGYPGNIILCGHTHGGQVNLPWMWKKFTLLENLQFKKGLIRFKNKLAYINRGLGSVMTFRWFSPPEILLLTLVK